MNLKTFSSYTYDLDSKLSNKIKEIWRFKNNSSSLIGDIVLSKRKFNSFKKLAKLNLDGKDITFKLKYKYFRNNKFLIKKGVFVPQYDTEQIIDIVKGKNINNGRALEIGSGTGVIAISLSNETNLDLVSIDINSSAIKLSKKNDFTKKVKFLKQDFVNFTSNEKFDIIISNPPYIDIKDNYVEKWVRENQPSNAIFAKEKGIYFYKLIFNKISDILNNHGYIILEIGTFQSKEIIKLSKKILGIKPEVIKDYSGLDRFIVVNYEKK